MLFRSPEPAGADLDGPDDLGPPDERGPRVLPTHPRPSPLDVPGPTWWGESGAGLGKAGGPLRAPVHAGPPTAAGAALAEPLATLLEVLAARLRPDVEPGVLDEGTTRAAVAVATAVLHASSSQRSSARLDQGAPGCDPDGSGSMAK